jgi:hypothetical protein
MAADNNNVAFERLKLLGQLADKEEEMRSKQIAVGIAYQAMLTAILELPIDRQVTALRGYIQRMERTISARSVQTVPVAKEEKHAASCNVAGSCAAPPATSPSSTCASLDSAHKRRRLLHRSEHPENIGAAGAHHGSGTFDSTDSPTVRKIKPPRDSLSLAVPAASERATGCDRTASVDPPAGGSGPAAGRPAAVAHVAAVEHDYFALAHHSSPVGRCLSPWCPGRSWAPWWTPQCRPSWWGFRRWGAHYHPGMNGLIDD